MKTYMEKAAEDTRQAFVGIRRDIASGYSPTDAINRNAHTAESYAAALKEYGLKPVIPD